MKTQQAYPKHYSFEFFPPKTGEGADKLRKVREELGQMNPAFFSVTFGAGGSTQQGTFDTVVEIQEAGYDAAPHLSCIGSTRERVSSLLQDYIDKNVKRIVALRGDIP